MNPANEALEVSEDGLPNLAKTINGILLGYFQRNHLFPILCLEGDLGAGKTRLVRSITELYGTDIDVSSPTFNLMNEYQLGNQTIYHFDLYRIQNPEEFISLDFEEIWNHPSHYCILEWWEKAKSILKKPKLVVEIEIPENLETRNYRWELIL